MESESAFPQKAPNRLAYLLQPVSPALVVCPPQIPLLQIPSFLPSNISEPLSTPRPTSPRQSFNHALSSLTSELHRNRSSIQRLEAMLDRLAKDFQEKKNLENKSKVENSGKDALKRKDRNDQGTKNRGFEGLREKQMNLVIAPIPKVVQEVSQIPSPITKENTIERGGRVEIGVLPNLSNISEVESVQSEGTNSTQPNLLNTPRPQPKPEHKEDTRPEVRYLKKQKNPRMLSAKVFCYLFALQAIGIGSICLVNSFI